MNSAKEEDAIKFLKKTDAIKQFLYLKKYITESYSNMTFRFM